MPQRFQFSRLGTGTKYAGLHTQRLAVNSAQNKPFGAKICKGGRSLDHLANELVGEDEVIG